MELFTLEAGSNGHNNFIEMFTTLLVKRFVNSIILIWVAGKRRKRLSFARVLSFQSPFCRINLIFEELRAVGLRMRVCFRFSYYMSSVKMLLYMTSFIFCAEKIIKFFLFLFLLPAYIYLFHSQYK